MIYRIWRYTFTPMPPVFLPLCPHTKILLFIYIQYLHLVSVEGRTFLDHIIAQQSPRRRNFKPHSRTQCLTLHHLINIYKTFIHRTSSYSRSVYGMRLVGLYCSKLFGLKIDLKCLQFYMQWRPCGVGRYGELKSLRNGLIYSH